MYKRYISLLLEYSSAFLVMLTPIWNLTFVLAQLKLPLEMKVVDASICRSTRPRSELPTAQIVLGFLRVREFNI
jgi:hypothetical protein